MDTNENAGRLFERAAASMRRGMKPMSSPAWRVYSAAVRALREAGGTVGLVEMQTAAALADALEAGDIDVAREKAEGLGIALADLPGVDPETLGISP